MGRKYSRGRYGWGTYDLGKTQIRFAGTLDVVIMLSGRMTIPRWFTGEIQIPITINGTEYIGPFWGDIGIGTDPWIPIIQPPDFWVPVTTSSKSWTPVTEIPPQFKA